MQSPRPATSTLARACHATLTLCATLAAATSTAHAAGVPGRGTWETTLQARDLDGNAATAEAYYDTALDITWLADANYAQTSGADADGLMTWQQAQSWVGSLNVHGVTGWRLPTWTNPSCNFGFTGTGCGYNVNTQGAELAHLFHVTLGNLSLFEPVPGAVDRPAGTSGLLNTGPFVNHVTNGVNDGHWYGTADGSLWSFHFGNTIGLQSSRYNGETLRAWAVYSGDVSNALTAPAPAVPEPASLAMVLAGLLVVASVAQRRSR